jgi:hypothetical protein
MKQSKHNWPATATVVAGVGALFGPLGAHADTRQPETLRVPRNGSITLPVKNISKIISSDEDIVLGRFTKAGQGVLQGVSSGRTNIEVYDKNANRRTYVVQVIDDSAFPNTDAPSTSAAATSAPVPAAPSAPASNMPSPAAPSSTTPVAPLRLGNEDTTPVAVPPTAAPAAAVSGTLPADTLVTTGAATPSNLQVSMRVAPVQEDPAQALFTITYSNSGAALAPGVRLHYALDDAVSYVSNSATGNATFDPAARELVWDLGAVAGGTQGSVAFRVQPIEPQRPVTFYSVATIEDANGTLVASNPLVYTNAPTPLLTVFALPDRILAGRTAPVMVDVKGTEYQTSIDRMQAVGVVQGREPGLYYPNQPTQRAEYTVLTLRALNLRDLRDMTAIKFVLGQRATVNLDILNSDDKVVASLIQNSAFDRGEHAVIWDGRTGTGFAPPGRYTYVVTATAANGTRTELQGQIYIMPQTPLVPQGTPSFTDIKPTDWHAGYIATAEKQDLVRGYPDGTFKPKKPISREEATAIAVRGIGLEDVARNLQGRHVGFRDDGRISPWATGYVAAAATQAKTAGGKPLMRGTPDNAFHPGATLQRDDAALIAQRMVDRETNRKISISGMLVPGATVTIQGQTVRAGDDGRFQLVLDLNTVTPITVAVIDSRR